MYVINTIIGLRKFVYFSKTLNLLSLIKLNKFGTSIAFKFLSLMKYQIKKGENYGKPKNKSYKS